MRHVWYISTICLLLLQLHSTDGYGSGAPTSVCDTMIPGHRNTAPQKTSPPFHILLNATSVKTGEKVAVTLKALKNDYPFIGFLLEARNLLQQSVILGRFSGQDLRGKFIDCGNGTNNAVTHTSPTNKTEITLQWQPPRNFNGSVMFRATFVNQYTTYWTDIDSKPVAVISLEDSSTSSFYTGCFETKGCFGYPSGCETDMSCRILTTYSLGNDSKSYIFEILGESQGYVALGLSFDLLMGNDSVMECIYNNDQVNAALSWNTCGDHVCGNTALLDQNINGISHKSGNYTDGWLSCTFYRDIVTTVEGFEFNLTNPFGLLLAIGNITQDKLNRPVLEYHDHRLASPSYVTLSSTAQVEATTEASSTNAIYNGCFETQGCFGMPSGCEQSRTCNFIATYAPYKDGNQYLFNYYGQSGGYLAMALSNDNLMGDDSVVDCDYYNGVVKASMSWNTNTQSNVKLSNQTGITQLNSSYENGYISCSFLRDTTTTVQGQTFDLANTSYFLLLAFGSVTNNDNLKYHGINKVASSSSVALSTVGFVMGSPIKIPALWKVHACFMVLAWMGCAGLGMTIARYYKGAWPGQQLLGKDVWFTVHRALMSSTWILMIIAVTCIFCYVGGWVTFPPSYNPHAVLGIISSCLAFIQPIMAAFRPHPGTSKRPIFNWLHWGVGNLAYLFAILAIFFGSRLSVPDMPESATYAILISYVVFHAFTNCILSYFQYKADSPSARQVSPEGKPKSGKKAREADSTTRKSILGAYVMLDIFFVVFLILIICCQSVKDSLS